ncbi:hypothetical protein DFH08DRAFT_826056 [Mycena albidolilacea]|uniref:Uncharacterized protein n=1 Tax=Mycena albidolilacea TaxID=1033008 RepID=A0AAD6Z190_9AGAR|nr:hypothetical protein DFH08DRAFT_826056 [Mycena albidolilacea]
MFFINEGNSSELKGMYRIGVTSFAYLPFQSATSEAPNFILQAAESVNALKKSGNHEGIVDTLPDFEILAFHRVCAAAGLLESPEVALQANGSAGQTPAFVSLWENSWSGPAFIDSGSLDPSPPLAPGSWKFTGQHPFTPKTNTGFEGESGTGIQWVGSVVEPAQ